MPDICQVLPDTFFPLEKAGPGGGNPLNREPLSRTTNVAFAGRSATLTGRIQSYARIIVESIKVVWRDPAELKPYKNNSRTHSEEQGEQVSRSIREFGWTIPILVDENDMILAGHLRQRRAIADKLKKVPVIVKKGLTEQQKHAYVIADNRLAENAGWDKELLSLELTELDGADFDLDLLGFEDWELKSLLDTDEPLDPTEEWKGMPEFNQQDKTSFRAIVVHFKGPQQLEEFKALVKQKITDNTRYIWFPEIEIETTADKVYRAT